MKKTPTKWTFAQIYEAALARADSIGLDINFEAVPTVTRLKEHVYMVEFLIHEGTYYKLVVNMNKRKTKEEREYQSIW